MATYAVDSKRQEMTATGIVDEVFQWVKDPQTQKRKQSKIQDHHEDTGMPLWNVEVSYRRTVFGRTRTVSEPVVVGHPNKPEVEGATPVTFTNLTVDVFSGEKGMRESWRAEALADFTPAKETKDTTTTPARGSQPKDAAA